MSMWTQEKRSHVSGNKNPLIPAIFQVRVTHLCSTEETLLKGRSLNIEKF